MARKIDFDNLSNDDLHYLSQRSHLVKEAELQGYSDIRDKIAAVDSEEEAEDGHHTDYNSATVAQLREELKSRDLNTDGNKSELVARLEEDDNEEDDEEDDEEEA